MGSEKQKKQPVSLNEKKHMITSYHNIFQRFPVTGTCYRSVDSALAAQEVTSNLEVSQETTKAKRKSSQNTSAQGIHVSLKKMALAT